MPKAIQVTERNLAFINEYADDLGFNLDYLKDSLEDLKLYRDVASKAEVLYLITDGSRENHNVTFTTFAGADFDRLWKFAEPESPTHFAKIERV